MYCCYIGNLTVDILYPIVLRPKAEHKTGIIWIFTNFCMSYQKKFQIRPWGFCIFLQMLKILRGGEETLLVRRLKSYKHKHLGWKLRYLA